MESTDLKKFLDAQDQNYDAALSEIISGRKSGHWMWYIFPQVLGLGTTSTSVNYAIKNIQHATSYFQHPVLGKRLIEISEAILFLQGRSSNQILGSPDDLKLKSSMTLFNMIPDTDPVFQKVLDKYFDGNDDKRTIDYLKLCS